MQMMTFKTNLEILRLVDSSNTTRDITTSLIDRPISLLAINTGALWVAHLRLTLICLKKWSHSGAISCTMDSNRPRQ